MMFGLLWLSLLAMSLSEAAESTDEGIKCLRDPGGPDEPVNIYYCKDPDLPECCELDDEFTCCENNKGKNMKEQALLWGLVSGVIVIVFIVCLCMRNESHLCTGPTLKQRCILCCNGLTKDRHKFETMDEDRSSSAATSAHWEEGDDNKEGRWVSNEVAAPPWQDEENYDPQYEQIREALSNAGRPSPKLSTFAEDADSNNAAARGSEMMMTTAREITLSSDESNTQNNPTTEL